MLIVGVGALALALAAIGIWVWYWKSIYPQVASNATIGAAVPLSNNNSSKTIPLSSDDTPDPNALKVVSEGNGQTGSASLSSSSPGASNSSSSSSTDTPDKFKEYDKYKDASDALFGEIVVGAGPVAEAGKQIIVNYRGWLTDGRLFDDSYQKGKPFVFIPGEHKVILGWEQGVLGMKVGGKRRLIVPPVVGYGAEGKDPIPGNAVLVFDIELVGVQ